MHRTFPQSLDRANLTAIFKDFGLHKSLNNIFSHKYTLACHEYIQLYLFLYILMKKIIRGTPWAPKNGLKYPLFSWSLLWSLHNYKNFLTKMVESLDISVVE